MEDRAQREALNDCPIGSAIFYLETKEKIVKKTFLTFDINLRCDRMTFFLFVCSELTDQLSHTDRLKPQI